VRLGLRQREERHWGAFFLGLLIGAVGGVIAALLLAPKRGTEMRRELAIRADEVRTELSARADEMVTKAKDADWVPIFQRPEGGNGQPEDVAESTEAVREGAAEAGTASGEIAQGIEPRTDAAADEAAEAINEAYDTVDRESRT
jgi:gas vesicle protein